MSRIVVSDLAGADDVARSAAKDLATELARLLESQQDVNLVLTGGTVGIKVLNELAPLMHGLDLSRLEIWWGDDRFVEPDSPDRNSVQAREALLSRVSIPDQNIHEMPSIEDGDLEAASKAFSAKIDLETPHFDIVLLGMGPDGHVASLFPGSMAIKHGNWVVAEPDSPKPPQQRISLSYDALSSAKQVWFLVAGKDKAPAVSKVFEGENLPAARVSGKELTKWYLDQEAASGITS
jgi:6-phosphogluconolactonase